MFYTSLREHSEAFSAHRINSKHFSDSPEQKTRTSVSFFHGLGALSWKEDSTASTASVSCACPETFCARASWVFARPSAADMHMSTKPSEAKTVGDGASQWGKNYSGYLAANKSTYKSLSSKSWDIMFKYYFGESLPYKRYLPKSLKAADLKCT